MWGRAVAYFLPLLPLFWVTMSQIGACFADEKRLRLNTNAVSRLNLIMASAAQRREVAGRVRFVRCDVQRDYMMHRLSHRRQVGVSVKRITTEGPLCDDYRPAALPRRAIAYPCCQRLRRIALARYTFCLPVTAGRVGWAIRRS